MGTSTPRSRRSGRCSRSAVIASAGVLAESTATVIGAMIIAPLSTPIMGIALAVVKGSATVALATPCPGARPSSAWASSSPGLPASYDLVDNSQIARRTSTGSWTWSPPSPRASRARSRWPVATSLRSSPASPSPSPWCPRSRSSASAPVRALPARRGRAHALPVEPVGARALRDAGLRHARVRPRQARRQLDPLAGRGSPSAALLLLIALPLVGNTIASYALTLWEAKVQSAAGDWVEDTPGATITSVDNVSTTFYIHVRSPADLPPVEELMSDIEGVVPDGFRVVVVSSRGEELASRTVGA